MLKVLGISGSLRKDSYNRKALQGAKKMAAELGAEVREIDLKDLNLPLYDGDVEARGFPESVLKLKRAVEEADVLLIATPEYNHSISGVLKNAIDWLSRGTNSLDGKIAATFGASTGQYGTVRAQIHLRQILFSLNVFVLPQVQSLIPLASETISPEGEIKNAAVEAQLKKLVEKTLAFAKKIKVNESR